MVDRDSDYAASLKPFLEAKLGQVHWAESEKQAEKILAEQNINLLLLDVMLSEPDSGLRWCRRLRNSDEFAELPIFLLSSVDERFGLNLKSKLAEPGYCPVQGFFDKSDQPSEIVSRLEKFFRSRR